MQEKLSFLSKKEKKEIEKNRQLEKERLKQSIMLQDTVKIKENKDTIVKQKEQIDLLLEKYRQPAGNLDSIADNIYMIKCAKYIRTKYGDSYVLLLENDNVYFSNVYINAVINKLVKNGKLVKWEDKNLLIYYNKDFKSFLAIEKGKKYWDKNRNIKYNYTVVENTDALQNKKITKDVEDKMEFLNCRKVNIKDSKRLETLEESQEYIINSIGAKQYRGKDRYTFSVKGEEDYFVSNTFMEKYKNLELSNTLTPFGTVGVKTTKSNNKEVVVVFGIITVTNKARPKCQLSIGLFRASKSTAG